MRKIYLSLLFFCSYMFMSSQDIKNIEVYKNININYTKSVNANNSEISYYEGKIATLEKRILDIIELDENIDFIRKSNTLAPKDEFETTDQFNKRIEEYKEREINIEEKVEKIYSRQIDSIKLLLKNEKESFYRETLKKHLEIKEQLISVSQFLNDNPISVIEDVDVSSLEYDADKEMFTLESSQFASNYEIKVSLSKAKQFKENIESAKFVIAYKRIIGIIVDNVINENVTQLSYDADFLCKNNILYIGKNGVCNIEIKEEPLRFTAPYTGSNIDGFAKTVSSKLGALNKEVNSGKTIDVEFIFKKSGQIEYEILSDNLSEKKRPYIQELLFTILLEYEFVPAKNNASLYHDIRKTVEITL